MEIKEEHQIHQTITNQIGNTKNGTKEYNWDNFNVLYILI